MCGCVCVCNHLAPLQSCCKAFIINDIIAGYSLTTHSSCPLTAEFISFTIILDILSLNLQRKKGGESPLGCSHITGSSRWSCRATYMKFEPCRTERLVGKAQEGKGRELRLAYQIGPAAWWSAVTSQWAAGCRRPECSGRPVRPKWTCLHGTHHTPHSQIPETHRYKNSLKIYSWAAAWVRQLIFWLPIAASCTVLLK